MCDSLSPEQLAQVAAPFRRSTASRLVEKHRGARWLIEKAFQHGQEPPGLSTGVASSSSCRRPDTDRTPDTPTTAGAKDLAHRRLESGAWVPWTPRDSKTQRSRALPLFLPSSAPGAASPFEAVAPRSGSQVGHFQGSIRSETESAAAEAAATGELSRRLHDTDEHVRWRAARALSALGEGAVSGLQASALAECLSDDKEANVRWAAAEALGRAGPATAAALGASEASHALKSARLQDPSRSTRWEISDASARVGVSRNHMQHGDGRSTARTRSGRADLLQGPQPENRLIAQPECTPPPLRVMLCADGRWR